MDARRERYQFDFRMSGLETIPILAFAPAGQLLTEAGR
jgi:hypothetical protein